MAKYDVESTATSRITAAAQLFKSVAEAGPVAELMLAGTNAECPARIQKAARVALFRLDRQLKEFLSDPEVASDDEAIAKAKEELNAKRALQAQARLPASQRR